MSPAGSLRLPAPPLFRCAACPTALILDAM